MLRSSSQSFGETETTTLTAHQIRAESFQRRTCLDSRLRGTFNLRDAWVRELQDAKLVATQHVASRDNLADLLTKPFSSSDFKRLVSVVLNSN